MKKYIVPKCDIIEIDEIKELCTSGRGGCTCGCCNNPDGSNTGGGCWGCPDCDHDNSGNHNCSNSKDDVLIDYLDDEL